MQNNSNPAGAGAWWKRDPRGKLKVSLWLLNGALVGALVYALASQHLENRRLDQARREVAALFSALTPKLDQHLAAAGRLHDDLKGDLLTANFASASDTIKPATLRPKARQIKARLDAAELALKRFSEEAANVGTRFQLRHDAQLFDPAQRQQFEALALQLDDQWQELAAVEAQLDSAMAHWVQLLEKEKAAQARQVVSAADEVRRMAAETQQLTAALQRAQQDTDRARVDSLHDATLAALRQPQAAPVMNQVVYPAPPTPPLPYCYPDTVYGVPGYYGTPQYYPARLPRGRSLNYYYNWRYPNVHRFGPYLVIN